MTIPTEAEEVAANLPLARKGATLDEVRAHVRGYMPDESVVFIDNVAEALWRNGKRERAETIRRSFANEAEAAAFCEGLDYVNDSAIKFRRERCVVVIEDEDAPR